jgi:hypothetical protein
MATVSLSLMLGMLGLGVDLGWAYFRREAVQTAADAAAAAVVRAAMSTSPNSQACGSNKVWCGSPTGTATNCPATAVTSASTSFDNGCMLAAANGFTTSGSRTVSIQANTTSPAPTVPGTAVTYWATVRVSESVVPFFGSPGNDSPFTSSAVSTAAIESSGAVSNDCVYVLSTTASPALTLSNGAHMTTSSCGVAVNSNSTTGSMALNVSGGATLTSNTVNVVGNYATSNGGSISSTPHTGVAAAADPFASLPSQTPAGTCNSGNFTAWQATAYTPTAGTYCGFSLGNGMNATMGPGIYIINGGTFSIQGGSTLTGTSGVMVYLTGGATVSIANGATVDMTAQSSGTYEGILFYQDRSSSVSSSDFGGGASMTFNGTLYMPESNLTFDNGVNSATTVVVANTINFEGGATFNAPTTQSQTGLPVSSTSAAVIQ